MIEKVLIANRGEIACRIIDTCRELEIASVAVYSGPDCNARHVRLADEAVHIGPAQATQSYLNIGAVIDAATSVGADAVHPGYGFLSENAAFAEALAQAGIIFLGPPAHAIETMGDKISAKAAVSQRNVPVVPGISRPGLTDDELIAAGGDIGFPVLIKPSAGGGGKGMHRVDDAAGLPSALATARREARAAFGDDTLFLERFVDTPRHIEVQVLADTHGSVIHLGERECSLQRRHQKVIEEAPSPLLDAETRARIGQAACDAARSVGYTGVGTVEFIVSAARPDEFFFMEMNTRLQVEHPVTELITGIDLVAQQIHVANGHALTLTQDDVTLTGHAMEARVYAEDPAAGFIPTGGTISGWQHPASTRRGPVRIDSGIETGDVIGSDYDPMLAKVIVHSHDREHARQRLDVTLAATHLTGVRTNIDFCRAVLADHDVIAGNLDTELLDRFAPGYTDPAPTSIAFAAAAVVALADARGSRPNTHGSGPWASETGWRIGGAVETIVRCEGARVAIAGDDVRVDYDGDSPSWQGRVTNGPQGFTIDGRSRNISVVGSDDGWWVASADGIVKIRSAQTISAARDAVNDGDVASPMPGAVVAVSVETGATVAAGDVLVVIEAMKMEQPLIAPRDGVVEVNVAVGDKVAAAHVVARVTPQGDN